MKKLKVSIQDEHTLVLQEPGEKGDLIDLHSIHETDIDQSSIANVVNSIKRDAFNDALQKERETLEQKMALEARLKEQELNEKVRLLEKDKESATQIATANAKTISQADLAKKETEIADLRAKLQTLTAENQLAVSQAVSKVEKNEINWQMI